MRKLFFALLLFFTNFIFSQEKKEESKEIKLEEVKVKTTKKVIEVKADRTIFDFSLQTNLSSGSVLEGLKKLPGLIVSDVAGMVYQGKQLEVFMDGRPLNIFSDELNSFLEGLPANAIQRIEIITQPGAEFPATSGGAILNIITSKSAKNYLSATYNSAVNFTNYDKFRTRFNNNLLLSAKNKYFGWKLNFGQNYRENTIANTVSKTENNLYTVLSKTDADRINRANYIKSGLSFDLNKDRLLLNYDLDFSNNQATIIGIGKGFDSNDFSKTKTNRQDFVITYQKRFTNYEQKLDFSFDYLTSQNDFNLKSNLFNTNTLDNNSYQKFITAKIDYVQPLKFLDKGKAVFGILHDELNFETQSFGYTNLNLKRKTYATYAELQTSYKKFDFILGTRLEDYNISGKTNVSSLFPFKQTRFFPNTTIKYNVSEQVFLSANYNKKIGLPSISELNPNNSNYQNQNVTFGGNPQLNPTVFDNFEIKIDAFTYAFLSYSISSAKNQIINRVLLDNNLVTNNTINIPEINIHHFGFAIPIPYMLFTKGLQETLKFDINPDTLNFLYIYLGYQKHQIPDLNTKGFWEISLTSQIILPKKITFAANYNLSTSNGNYFYFVANKPLYESLDLSFSKKFMNNQLSISVFADDILNTAINSVSSVATPIQLINKRDTRRFGFTLSYKLPTKNKLAKEESNKQTPAQEDARLDNLQK